MSRKSSGKRRSDRDEAPPKPLRTPVAEQLLIETLPRLEGDRVLATTLGRGQFAAACAADSRDNVVCHVFDVYQAGQAQAHLAGSSVTVQCLADFAPGEYDAVAIPVDMQGEAELTRDLLQAGHERLRIGGHLLAATNNPRDRWLAGEFARLFAKVSRYERPTGIVYAGEKAAPLKKRKSFECEFAFRDQGRLIKAVSRPGVFSHRSLDAGARALMNAVRIRANDRVLDVGCGSGVVAVAAAVREPGVSVLAVDSHTRAIECTARGAALNGLSSVSTRLTAAGDTDAPGTFDVVTANPPYYSHFRIAEIFLQSALAALRPGGRLYLVTKLADWYAQRMPQLFQKVKVQEYKSYFVLEGRRSNYS